MTTVPETPYEPAARASAADVATQHRLVSDEPNVCRMLDLQPEPTVVLNEQRQIVFANRACTDLFGVSPIDAIGKRFGEAVSCVNACKGPDGCGTTKFCGVCGLAKAIRSTRLEERNATAPCWITRRISEGPDSLELRVWTAPLIVGSRAFTVVAVRDASAEQRRHVLERIFFHDLLNTSGALKMLLKLVSTGDGTTAQALAAQAAGLTAQLVDEIEDHRDLLAAERGELVTHPSHVTVTALLEDIARAYAHYDVAPIHVYPCPPSATVVSDRVLLRRVLGNLLKNALEASKHGDRVDLRFEASEKPSFHVTNPAVMAPEVQLQVFQRSFSTKAEVGRGLGTYGARLLAERYLGGHLTFQSSADHGTTFTLALQPLALLRS